MTDSNPTPQPPVVVGVDGSEHALAAVELAADEAAHRQLPLEIVHAFVLPVMSRPATMVPDLPPMPPARQFGEPDIGSEYSESALREHAEEVLSAAAARVRGIHPELPMISRLRDGYPAEVLTEASQHAAMVVIGHRGVGGFAELLTGSVGVQLAHHAAAPVIIVRGERPRTARTGAVVVGVDGSDGSRRAARFALSTAAAQDAGLIALYAWPSEHGWAPAMAQAGVPPPSLPDDVAQILAHLADEYPQVTVHPEVRKGISAHEALVEASKNARMVVVGSRGRGGFKGLLLGSVSQALIHHGHCPIAVVGPESAQ